MKKLTLSVVFSLVAVLALVSSVFAAGDALPGTGWYTASTIQNVGTADGDITMTAYDSASTNTYPISQNVAPGGKVTFGPQNFVNLPAGFQGSAVVSSNQDIRAIVTVTNRYITWNSGASSVGDPESESPAAGQYQGMNVPNQTLSFPNVKYNSYNKTTTFYIQNAGISAATADLVFVVDGVTYNYTTPSIGANQMVVVSPGDAGVPQAAGGKGQKGALTVTSTQPLAGVVIEHMHVELHATVAQATRAFTPDDYDTTIFAPTNKNNRFGRFSGLAVQNVTAAPIDITVTYKSTAGACDGTYVATKTDVAAGASWVFPATAFPDNCNASATIEGTGNIVGLVNESYNSAFLAANPTRFQESNAYTTLPANSATQVISVPLHKEDAFDKGTGVSVQNVGAADANFSVTISNGLGTFTTIQYTLAPGKAKVFADMRNLPTTEWVGTPLTAALMGCTSTGCKGNGSFGMVVESADQNLIGIVQESTYPFTAPRFNQDKSTYEGFNLTAAP